MQWGLVMELISRSDFQHDATDGYDENLDFYAPPAPPPPAFDAALGWDGDRYSTQILNGSVDDLVEHVFDIILQYDESNMVTLSWDNTNWGILGSFQLMDAFDGALGIDVDMTSESSLSLDNPAFNTLKLKATPSGASMPSADFTADNTEGDPPLEVGFMDASEEGSSPIVSYSWDFGDEDMSDEQNPTHLYESDGNYDVSLTVADAAGLMDTETKVEFIVVIPPSGPDVDFTASLDVMGSSYSYTLTFGFSPNATDGYDDGLDSYAPPAPPPPSFDAALSWGEDRYYTQILEGDENLTEHVYDIQLQYPEDNLINITWDNTGWSDLGSFQLTDAFDGLLGIDIDMTVENSLTLDNSAFDTLKLKVTPMVDEEVDCAGTPNGNALEDNCGVCDSDPSNDNTTCAQDCAGVWGGTAVELWEACYPIETTTEINLPSSDLTGNIPPEIGNLTNLQKLYLNDNDLSGSIPWDEIINLTDLESLALSYNQLTGQIPSEIGDLTNLQHLSLSNNQLTGSIPWDEIGNLTMLQALSLGANQLTGSIPAEIGNLTNLQELYLDDNQFTGQIPAEIGALINLQWLDLNSNQLTGSIPDDIGNLTNLQKLYLNDNDLSGSIPAAICGLSNMDFSNSSAFWITGNALCPPYPGCVEAYVGNQNTDNCSSEPCQDVNACNFEDVGDCEYPEENYDCDGVCIVTTDCNGICGGDAVEDNCGTCDSDPSNDCSEPNFSASLNVSGGGSNYTLTFGFSPNATDGYDDGMDSYAPPAPPPPSFDAALGWDGDRYYTQIVNGSTDDLVVHEYNIALAYGSDELITLEWDNTGWSDLMSSISLQDAFGGVMINVDMLSESSLVLDNPALTTLKLLVTPIAGGYYEDCAGTPNGNALEDNCNVCDSDPSNDCVQDCDGTWGGAAVEDGCGTCDDDTSNDCQTCTPGDINKDGILNVLDIVIVVNIVLDVIEPNDDQSCAGDFNNDEIINVLDIVLLVNKILGSETTTVTIDHAEGWNMVSLPVDVEDSSPGALFSGSIGGTLYSYPYNAETDLALGEGYWLRFDSDDSDVLSGDPVDDVSVSLAEGWNIIGSVSDAAMLDDPSGIVIAGTMYGYPYSNPVSVIEPGSAYWVRASAAGDVTISSGAGAAKTTEYGFSSEGYDTPQSSLEPGKAHWIMADADGVITITDDGRSDNEVMDTLTNNCDSCDGISDADIF